jgi:hypothetical protein
VELVSTAEIQALVLVSEPTVEELVSTAVVLG